MREFVANFQKKHGQQVPMPKIYGTKTPLMTKVRSWRTGPKQPRRRPLAAAGGSGGGKPHKKPAAGGHSSGAGGTGRCDGPSTSGVAGLEVKSEVVMTMVMKMTLTSEGRRGMKLHHHHHWWLTRNHARRAQFTPQLTESCQFSTSLVRRENLAWPPCAGLD